MTYVTGITGPVAIDSDGNRIADFDLLDMKEPDTREFQVSIVNTVMILSFRTERPGQTV